MSSPLPALWLPLVSSGGALITCVFTPAHDAAHPLLPFFTRPAAVSWSETSYAPPDAG